MKMLYIMCIEQGIALTPSSCTDKFLVPELVQKRKKKRLAHDHRIGYLFCLVVKFQVTYST